VLLLGYLFPGPVLTSPTRHALLIGIGDHSDTGLSSFKGVYNDIILMRDLLDEERLGFDGNITVLLDKEAPHISIEQALHALAGDPVLFSWRNNSLAPCSEASIVITHAEDGVKTKSVIEKRQIGKQYSDTAKQFAQALYLHAISDITHDLGLYSDSSLPCG
jgi:hypothetical protein